MPTSSDAAAARPGGAIVRRRRSRAAQRRKPCMECKLCSAGGGQPGAGPGGPQRWSRASPESQGDVTDVSETVRRASCKRAFDFFQRGHTRNAHRHHYNARQRVLHIFLVCAVLIWYASALSLAAGPRLLGLKKLQFVRSGGRKSDTLHFAGYRYRY